WFFRPALLAEVARARSTDARDIHLRAVRALQQHSASRDRERQVAYHLREAVALTDSPEQRQPLQQKLGLAQLELADYALIEGSYAESLEAGEAALEVFREAGAEAPLARAQAIVAVCQAMMRNADAAREVGEQALGRLDAADDDTRFEVLVLCARACGASDPARWHALLKQARELYVRQRRRRLPVNPAMAARMHLYWAQLSFQGHVNEREAEAALRKALRLSRSGIHPRFRVYTLFQMGSLAYNRQRYANAAAAFRGAADSVGATAQERIDALNNVGLIQQRYLQDPGQAEHAFRDAIAEALRQAEKARYWHAWNNLGLLLAWEGRFSEGFSLLFEANRLATSLKTQGSESQIALHQGEAAWLGGWSERSRELLKAACHHATRKDLLATMLIYLGLSYLDLKDLQLAEQTLLESKEAAASAGSNDRWNAHWALVLLRFRQRTPEGLKEVAEVHLPALTELLPQCDRRVVAGQEGGYRPAWILALEAMYRLAAKEDWSFFLESVSSAASELHELQLRGAQTRLYLTALEVAMSFPDHLRDHKDDRKAVRSFLTEAEGICTLMQGASDNLLARFDDIRQELRELTQG
ncbi:MAG: hypothetical protein ACYCW6_01585, partial [Candidatus Xenobia bacterium]